MKIFPGWAWLRFFIGCGMSGFLGATAMVAAEQLKECPQCHGSGLMTCRAGCDHGVRTCPGHCLKLSVGHWEHLTVAGHPPTDLWQKFHNADGNGWQAWNQNHLGEVVEMRAGIPTLVGKCPVCGGTTTVTCTACKGKDELECTLCKGVGTVSVAVQAPVAPDEFPLKDGRVLKGRITVQHGQMLQIRTDDGKIVTLKLSDLADPMRNNQFR